MVADAYRSAMGPHDQALREDRAGSDVDVTEHHVRAGHLGLRLVDENLIETHLVTVRWAHQSRRGCGGN